MTAVLLVAAVLAAVAAYWVGRVRPGRWLLSWAEDRSSGSHGLGWWAAQVVGLVAVGWIVTLHPRRTAANRRSWREARREPAPVFDQTWVKRRAATRSQEGNDG